MALQVKTLSSSTVAGGTLKLKLTENSLNAGANTSSVSWRLYVAAGSSAVEVNVTAYSATVNGVSVCRRTIPGGMALSVAAGGEATIDSGTLTVTHNTDGGKTMSASSALTSDRTGTLSLSGSMALTNISRASTLTATGGNPGVAHTLTINRSNSGFTHTVTYACGSAGGTIAAKTTSTSLTWTPPASLSAQASNSKTVDLTYTLTTYNGSTSLGSTTKTVALTIPPSALSAANGALGAAQSLTIAPMDSRFTHTVAYTCGGASGTIVTKTSGTAVSFTPPRTLAAQAAAGQKTVALTYTMTTYNGTAALGSVSKTVTMSLAPSTLTVPSGTWTLGAARALTIARDSAAFTHTVTYVCGGVSGTVAAKTDKTTLSFTPPKELAAQAASGKTVSLTLKTTTYHGAAAVGATTTAATLTIPPSALSVASGALGTAQTLTVTRASDNLTHTVTYACGGLTGQTAGLGPISGSGTTQSCVFTPPVALAAQNTAGTSVSVTITLTTRNGQTTVGSAAKTVTMTIPASVKPGCSATVTAVSDNATVSGWGVAVKGYSKYRVTTSFVSAQGSTPVSRSVKIAATGQTMTASPATSAVLTSTDRTVRLTVTDSRGRASDTVTVSGPVIYDYGRPSLNRVEAYRCSSAGVAADDGTYLYVKCAGEVFSCGGHNGKTVQFRRRAVGGSWGGWTTLVSGTGKTVNAGLDPAVAYEVHFRVTDSLGSERSVVMSVPSASVTLHLKAGGSGAAFGGYAQTDNMVDFTTWDVVGRVNGLGRCPAIPANSDLDAYETPGVYAAGSNSVARSLSNCPSIRAGRLVVTAATGARSAAGDNWKYLIQAYTDYFGSTYQRKGESGSGTQVVWDGWKLIHGVDAVVESGQSGNWHYLKYDSGAMALWGLHNVSPASSLAVGGCYRTEPFTIALPVTLSSVTVSGSLGTGYLWIGNAYPSGSDLKFTLLSPVAIDTTKAYTVRLQVWGRWK